MLDWVKQQLPDTLSLAFVPTLEVLSLSVAYGYDEKAQVAYGATNFDLCQVNSDMNHVDFSIIMLTSCQAAYTRGVPYEVRGLSVYLSLLAV